MATGKKIVKSKLTDNVSPSTDSSKEKKTEKRERNDPFEMGDDEMSKPISYNQANKKKAKLDSDAGANVKMFKSMNQLPTSTKKKTDPDTEAGDFMSGLIGQYKASMKNTKASSDSEAAEVRKKVLELLGEQCKARKQYNENLFKNFSDIISQTEADYDVMKENDQKLEQLSVSFMKYLRQATVAFKEKAKALNEILSSEKQVEGLLARGGIKPDERAIWFDVYRAFPPLVEPKFARAKPEITPIRQIYYKEDIIRAQFHSNGHGLGAVNMLAPSNDTQTKRLVQEYEKLKSEGILEEELIEKSATAVGIERKDQYEATAATKPAKATDQHNSVTAQVLAEADLKNIFK